MIENKFLYFKTYQDFQDKLSRGNIDSGSVAFIEDKSIIWTHNNEFQGGQQQVVLDNINSGSILPERCWDCVYVYKDQPVFTVPIVYQGGNYLFAYAQVYTHDAILDRDISTEKAWMFRGRQVEGCWENSAIPAEMKRYVPADILHRLDNIEEYLTWD